MPPEGKLSDAVIADFEKWISMGLHDPRDAPVAATGPKEIDWDRARNTGRCSHHERRPLLTSKKQRGFDVPSMPLSWRSWKTPGYSMPNKHRVTRCCGERVWI